jgi:RimJ/RimL family protein N-acetyltransferase
VIRIERSTDYSLIKGVMTHPAVYRHLTDDTSPPADEFRPIESDLFWYLLAWDGNELLGLWLLVPHSAVCWEIHTALLPDAWGERARQAATVALEWIWTHTPCRRIVTGVPQGNRVAFRFALAAGMEQYGVNEASFLRGGRMLDQICLGISRPRDLPLYESAEVPIPGDCSLVAQSAGQKEG